MENNFHLHSQLQKDTYFIGDLPLSCLLLVNDCLYPWFILVPRRNNTTEIVELSYEHQHSLMDEISKVSQALKSLFIVEKLNVAALGNMVPQLHIHIVGRTHKDKAWPKPVWGVAPSIPYSHEKKEEIISQVQNLLFPS